MSWQFKTVYASEAPLLDEELDRMGMEHWELITVVPLPDGRYSYRFRREELGDRGS